MKKYATLKLDHFPKIPGGKSQKLFETTIFGLNSPKIGDGFFPPFIGNSSFWAYKPLPTGERFSTSMATHGIPRRHPSTSGGWDRNAAAMSR